MLLVGARWTSSSRVVVTVVALAALLPALSTADETLQFDAVSVPCPWERQEPPQPSVGPNAPVVGPMPVGPDLLTDVDPRGKEDVPIQGS